MQSYAMVNSIINNGSLRIAVFSGYYGDSATKIMNYGQMAIGHNSNIGRLQSSIYYCNADIENYGQISTEDPGMYSNNFKINSLINYYTVENNLITVPLASTFVNYARFSNYVMFSI